MLADATSTSSMAAALVVSLVGLSGSLITLGVTQRNRRQDRIEREEVSERAARLEETRVALESWKAIVSASAQQIASLTKRLDTAQQAVDRYENEVVPALEAEINRLQAHIAELEDKK